MVPRWFARLVLGAFGFVVACAAESGGGPDAEIRPQPQPNRREALFAAPCTATACGEAPTTLSKPRCAPAPADCAWSEDEVVSYAACEDASCGTAPGAEVCPSGTTFKGNACGSENGGACRWTTTCAPPPSTTACTSAAGCGPMPELGVLCSDGGTGELVCMQFDDRCAWQRSCD